jgi:cytoskeletal protein CcmA (bactofilin family)
MSAPKRRFLEGSSATPTFIGAESVFVGNIRGAGHFVVSGEVHGDGELQGGLNLSASGSWHGFIQAEQAIVAGKITGGLNVRDKLEIGYTAVIRGKVSARTIAIAKGAIVDGEIEVTSDCPCCNSRKAGRQTIAYRAVCEWRQWQKVVCELYSRILALFRKRLWQ